MNSKKRRQHGVVRECIVVRSGWHSDGRDGTVGGFPREACLRSGSAGSDQILLDYPVPAPAYLRGCLAPILWWRSSPRLVHQAFSRLPRSDPNTLFTFLYSLFVVNIARVYFFEIKFYSRSYWLHAVRFLQFDVVFWFLYFIDLVLNLNLNLNSLITRVQFNSGLDMIFLF